MTNDFKQSEQKRKILPPGVEQVGFKEYNDLRNKELEKRNKKKKISHTTDKIVQIVMIILALPFLGLIFFILYSFLITARGTPTSP